MRTTTQLIPLLCLLAQIDALAIPDAQTAEVASLTDLTHKHVPWAIPMLVRAGGAVGDMKYVKKLHASTSGALDSLASSNILAGLGLDTSRMSWFQHTVTVTETTSNNGPPAASPMEAEPKVIQTEHHAEISPSTEVVNIPFLPQVHVEEHTSHEQSHLVDEPTPLEWPAHAEPAHVEPARAEPAYAEPAHVEPAHMEQPAQEESHELAPFAAAAMADMVGEVFNVHDTPLEITEMAHEADKAAEAPAPAPTPVEVVQDEQVQSPPPPPPPQERQHNHQGEL